MTRLFVSLVSVLVLTVPVAAQWRYVANVPAITIDNTAGGVAITSSYVNGSGHVQANVGSCVVSVAQVRYTIDGVAPTATFGYLVDIGGQIALSGNDVLTAFRAIRTGATSGVIDCVVGAQ